MLGRKLSTEEVGDSHVGWKSVGKEESRCGNFRVGGAPMATSITHSMVSTNHHQILFAL